VCRHLACLGTVPRSLGDLLLEPEGGLLVQSYAPRRQRNGLMNADAWGVAFYPASRPDPARWRPNRPLWADGSFASVAPVISSTYVLAAVRSGSELKTRTWSIETPKSPRLYGAMLPEP